MNCPKCDTPIDYRFSTVCPQCGYEMEGPAQRPAVAPKGHNREPAITLRQGLANFAYFISMAVAGTILGAILVFGGAAVTYAVVPNQPGPRHCGEGMAIFWLSTLGGGILGCMGGGILGIVNRLYKPINERS